MTQQEHDAAHTRNSDEYIEPWTAYIEETNSVSYNIINWSERYLTIEMLESGTCTFQIANNLPTSSCTDVSYSLDGGKTWTTTENVDGSLVTITTPNLNAGDKVLWKGNATTYSTSYTGEATICSKFSMGTTKFNVSGNIASMLYGDNFEEEGLETTKPYAVSNFFRNASGLIRADNLILPFMKLQQYSFAYMFCNCSSLIEAPQLPATNLSYGANISHDCYLGMFSGCSSLTKAPELPATTLATYCYYQMFSRCSLLTTAPALPATTLTRSCYEFMFRSCPNLTSAPALPATTAQSSCYRYMFNDCTSLTTAPALPATTLSDACYQAMFQGCTSLTTAPELPANTLTANCYRGMFYGCGRLNYVKMLATDISATDCLLSWVYGVSPTGNFVKNSSMTTLPSGTSGIPSGWTVVDETP